MATAPDSEVHPPEGGSGEPPVNMNLTVTQTVGSVQAGRAVGVDFSGVVSQVNLFYTRAPEAGLRPYTGKCPYRGLAPFEEQDARYFYGRARLVAELLPRLQNESFLLLAGPSGSGKSSLAKAGLVAQLRAGKLPGSDNWLYASFTPGRHPLAALWLAMASQGAVEQNQAEFVEAAHNDYSLLQGWAGRQLDASGASRLVLLADQFEELFAAREEIGAAGQVAFLAQLTRAVQAGSGRVLILATLRSDFLGHCNAHAEFNALVNRGFHQVGAMDVDELVDAVARPAAEEGVPVERELVAQVIVDMYGRPGALPLMQFALQRLFFYEQALQEPVSLTLQRYQDLGGLGKILSGYADGVLSGFKSDELRSLAERVLLQQVQVGTVGSATRRVIRISELAELASDSQLVEEVINELAHAWLVTVSGEQGAPFEQRTVTLAHDTLLEDWPRLHDLVEANRQQIALVNEIESDALRWEHSLAAEKDGYLLAGARLATAQEGLESKKIILSEQGRAFVLASAEAQQAREQAERRAALAVEREKRQAAEELANARQASLKQQKRWLAVAAVLLIVALGFLGWALWAQQNAARSARSALDNAAAATKALGISLERSTEVALSRNEAQIAATQIADERDHARQQAAVARAGELAAYAANVRQQDSIQGLLLSLQAWKTSDTPPVSAWQALADSLTSTGGLPLAGSADCLQPVVSSPDGRWIACLDGAYELLLWDLASPGDHPEQTAPFRLGKPGFYMPDTPWLFFGGRWLAVSAENATEIALWDLSQPITDTAPVTLEMDFNDHHMALSPQGRWLAAGPQLWDLGQQEGQAATQPPVAELGLPDEIMVSAFSPRERYLAQADASGNVALWDLQAAPQTIPALSLGQFNATPVQLAFSPDELWLACATDTFVYLWDLRPGHVITPALRLAEASDVVALAYSADGRWLAAGGKYSRVWVYDLHSPDLETLLQPRGSNVQTDDDAISALVFHPQNNWLVSGSYSGRVKFSAFYGDMLSQAGLELNNEAERIYDLKILPGERWLASFGVPVRFWDLNAGNVHTGLSALGFARRDLERASLSPDGRWLAGFTPAGRSPDYSDLNLWDLAAGDLSQLPVLLKKDVWSRTSSFSPDGAWLGMYSTTEGETGLDLWYLPGGSPPVETWASRLKAGDLLSALPEMGWLLPEFGVSALSASKVNVWLPGAASPAFQFAQEPLRLPQPPVIDKASLQATSYSADGRHVAASWIIPAEDNPEIYHCSLRMADLTDPAGGWIELDFIERTCGGLKFSPDGRWLAAGYEGSLLRLVEMASGASFDLSDIFHAATYYLEDFSFSPDARWLLIRGGDGLYRVDLAANDPSQAAGYLGNVSTDDFTSAFSPDQRLLAVYAARGQVEIYDLTSGVLLEKLKIMDWQVDSLAFSPGGRWLAAATPDGLRLWPAGPAGVLPFYRDAILLPVSLEFGFVLGFDPAARWVIFSSGMEYNLFKGSLWFWPLQGDLQFERGCASAGRNLTPGECDLYFPGEPCPQTCDQWR